ncbi:MAG TPA: tetratricopeptide repeat protein [Gemmataceae bacterium]|nr:tetratricopeptide repeat protein [Gemmataceae bacterium]
MRYAQCLRAHPFWLSTLKEFVPPALCLDGLPTPLQRQVGAGLDALRQSSHRRAAQELARARRKLVGAREGTAEVLTFLEALCHLLHGDRRSARLLMGEAIARQPRQARFHYGLGLLELEEGRPDEAVNAFTRATSLDPEFGSAWAALAVIHALCRMHAEAEAAARRTLALNVSLRCNLVGLVLTQATFCQGKPVEGPCDFSSLGRDPEALAADLLGQLSPVDPASLAHPPQGRPVLFIACDHVYAIEHALPLVWSVAESGTRCAIHLHVVNPGGGLREAVERLREAVAPLPVFLSTESVFVEQYAAPPVYYSCVRFARLYQLLCVSPDPVVMLDADCLVRGPLDEAEGLGEDGVDVGLCHFPEEPAWQEFHAGFGFYNPTRGARHFLARVTAFILDNIRKTGGLWFLDQVALYACSKTPAGGARARLLPADRYADLRHGPASPVWIVTTEKSANDRYNDYKKYLREQYAGDDLLPATPGPAELVSTRHGRMLIDQGSGQEPAHEIELLCNLVRPGHTVADAGAGVGWHALALGRLVGPHGRVYAFEARRLVRQRLAANLALNNVANVYCDVEPAPLDRLRLDACHLIRMDVGGTELEALRGAAETVRRHRPILYLANREGERRQALIDEVGALGYRAYWHGTNMLCLPRESRIQLGGFEEIGVGSAS